MKLSLLCFLILGFLSAAHANAESSDGNFSEGKTHFETVGDMFKSGTTPNPKKVSYVVWSGRCFWAHNQNAPKMAGLVFRMDKSDVGPRLKAKYQVFGFTVRGVPANFLDDKSYSQVTSINLWLESLGTDSLVKTQSELEKRFVDVIAENGVLTTPSSYDIASSFKISGKYLVSEVSQGSNSLQRCYYYTR